MTDAAKCPRCVGPHGIIACPLVKAVELEHAGDFNSIRRVEFLTPADWPAPTASKPPDEDGGRDYPRKGTAA